MILELLKLVDLEVNNRIYNTIQEALIGRYKNGKSGLQFLNATDPESNENDELLGRVKRAKKVIERIIYHSFLPQ